MLIGLALTLIDEREGGTLARLQASAAPLYATLLDKVIARFGVGFAQLVVLLAVGWALFGGFPRSSPQRPNRSRRGGRLSPAQASA
jgi:ABC-type transport system involved in cytochrome c biogenesis permease component